MALGARYGLPSTAAVSSSRITAPWELLAPRGRLILAGSESLPAPTASAPTQSGVADQIRKLAEFRDEGLLSPEGFDAKKRPLLGR